jgi:hypothetical protein
MRGGYGTSGQSSIASRVGAQQPVDPPSPARHCFVDGEPSCWWSGDGMVEEAEAQARASRDNQEPHGGPWAPSALATAGPRASRVALGARRGALPRWFPKGGLDMRPDRLRIASGSTYMSVLGTISGVLS